MIHICICDDKKDQLENLEDLTEQYIKFRDLDASVTGFLHPDELLLACQKQRYHIYILDVLMPMVNGIQVGVEIRRFDPDAVIVFVSITDEYALSSFSARPYNYILKPLKKEEYYQTLDEVIAGLDIVENSFAIHTAEGIQILRMKSIIYIEKVNKKVIVHTSFGEKMESVSIRSSFADYIEPLLKQERFIQPHISYVINMDYVKKITAQGFIMIDDSFVPIVQRKKTVIREAYFNYRFKGTGG